jgi:hypothetical protein
MALDSCENTIPAKAGIQTGGLDTDLHRYGGEGEEMEAGRTPRDDELGKRVVLKLIEPAAPSVF